MYRILVADDDPDILTVVEAVLESEGHDVQTTEDPFQVIALLEESPFDLVILDVMMPGLTGWYLLHQIRQNPALAWIPVLMLTALESSFSRERAGPDDFLTKPFQPADLALRVNVAITVGEARRRVAEIESEPAQRGSLTVA